MPDACSLPAAPRVAIVSAADEGYAPLLEELVDSVRAHPALDGIDLCLISTGLAPATRDRLRGKVQALAEGTWNIDHAGTRAKGREWLMGRVAKLFTRDYFPGYDIYIWIDADAWVCDPRAIDWLIEGVRRSGFAVAHDETQTGPLPVSLRRGLFGPVARTYTMKHLTRAGMPRRIVRTMATCRPFNNGVFALAGRAPHWQAAQDHMAALVRRGRIFGTNQLALMMAVHLDGLPVCIMPPACNYMDLPRVSAETGGFVEAILPHHPVGILHLADRDAVRRDPDLELDLLDTLGRPVRRGLRFRRDSLARPTADSAASPDSGAPEAKTQEKH